MSPDEWNKSDELQLELISSANPFERGHEGLDDVLGALDSACAELRPSKVSFERGGKKKYSRQLMDERFAEFQQEGNTFLIFTCAGPPEAYYTIQGYEGDEDSRFSLRLYVKPFSWFTEPRKQEERAAYLLSLVRAFASRLPLSHALAHSETDRHLDTDLDHPGPDVPPQIERMHWLNVYGPRMVQAIGRERVLSTPAFHVEELPHGAVLVLTRPTPADFHSEEARLAQARALVHLRPELNLEEVLSTLRRRSLAFTPIPLQFDPDVADILREELEFQGLLLQRQLVERYNHYRPPPVSEWLPAPQQPWSDVPDARAAIARYQDDYVEHLIAVLHDKVPSVFDRSPESLPRIDWYLWHMGWGAKMGPEQWDILVPALGAYLGTLLVRELKGQWVPRRNLDEAAVVVGDRAWLPFLRARHALQGRDAPLDFSLTQLFRQAARPRG